METISGPAACVSYGTSQAISNASFYCPGTYHFQLKVWNWNGESFDTAKVTVGNDAYCKVTRTERPAQLRLLSKLQSAVAYPQITSAGNKLIITSEFTDQFHVYDRVSGTWSLKELWNGAEGKAVLAVGNKVFFAGGVSNGPVPIFSNAIDIYDLITDTWSSATLSEPRAFIKAAVAGDKVLFAGGLKGHTQLSNTVDIYDVQLGTWSTTKLTGPARAITAAVPVQNRIYFAGGYTGGEDGPMGYVLFNPTKAIDVYDASTGSWSLDSLQYRKTDFAATSLNNNIYYAGGSMDSWSLTRTFDVEVKHTGSGTRSHLCLSRPTMYHTAQSAVVKDNQIIFFGGEGPERNKFDIYNPQTGEWSLGVLPAGTFKEHSSPAIIAVDGQMLIVYHEQLFELTF